MSVSTTAGRPVGSIVRAVPTVAVFVLLGAVAFWGHHTGWRVPKFSALFAAATDEEEWCEEHSVPEAICIECRKDLVPAAPAPEYCKTHGVPLCLWEHPEAAQTKSPPTVADARLAEVKRALDLAPRKENNPLCNLHERRIQFASAEAAEKAGVDIAVVDEGRIVESVVANCEVEYDRTRLAQMSSRVPGTVARVFKQVGDRVTRGELVAVVDSADVGRAKAELLQALAHHRLVHTNLERLRPLAKSGDVPERQFREAESADEEAHIKLIGARQTLVNLGFDVDTAEWENLSTDEASTRLQHLGLPSHVAAEVGPTSNLFPIRSPLDGYVLEREAVDGEAIAVGEPLFTAADTSRMWLIVDVRQDDVERLSPGLIAQVPTGGPNSPVVSGPIVWINTEADERTRMVKVRVELPNENGRLRAHTFGSAEIVLRENPQAIVVPSEAVHWEGCCNVVFVRDRNWFQPDSPKFFHVRKVRLGVRDGGRTEILAGLLPGEVIAAKGSSVLAAQLLKAKIGEGCECGGH